MPYNPFDKPIRTPLEANDLNALIANKVSEGYFVEYKSVLPKSEKIAKSIASFANTYGGWYIVGVETDGHNVATKISGFSLAEYKDPIASLRDAIRLRIDPAPLFFSQVVTLTDALVVLVVYVPGEQNTPFITSNGCIYRRVSDSSEPQGESHRFAIDRLYDQGHEHTLAFQRFCKDTRTFSNGESSTGWVNLYLVPSPLGLIEKPQLTSRESLEALLRRSQEGVPVFEGKREPDKPILGRLPFDQVRVSNHDSVFLKQSSSIHNTFSIELFGDGRTRIFLPLERKNFSAMGNARRQIRTPEVQSILQDLFSQNQDLEIIANFIDLAQLWATTALAVNFYLDWLGDDFSLISEFRLLIRGKNLWHTVPFADYVQWAEHVRMFHLPMLASNEITFPEDSQEGGVLEIGESPSTLWVGLLQFIGMMFGFPSTTSMSLVANFENDPRFYP